MAIATGLKICLYTNLVFPLESEDGRENVDKIKTGTGIQKIFIMGF
jgi:hypothetical protein